MVLIKQRVGEIPPPINVGPERFDLSQNYPNPFNPSTKIIFDLPSESNVKLFVYNLLGEKVRELVNGQVSAGVHTVDFNAGNRFICGETSMAW